MQFNSIDIYKYISGDLKLVGGLWVPKISTFLVILTKMKQSFVYVTTNIWYNSAKPYMNNQRGHIIVKQN